MRGVTASRISPGAETCVVVGALADSAQLDLRGYRSVLWFARDAISHRAPNIRVEPIAPSDPQRTTASLDALIRRDALHLPSVFVTDEVNGDSAPAFLPVIDAIFAQCEAHQRARATRQADGFSWQHHLLANLPHYAQRRVPPGWENALHGLPAIVCGAGPSLDASIERLKKFSGRAVVFAADSALRALARAGVAADFALSVDAGKTPAKCLALDAPPPGRVVVAGISPPEWRSAIAPGELFFLSGRQITEDWLASLGLEKTSTGVEENCGITALALARHLGCGPIYLFGMDHAVDSQNPARWHERNGAPGFDHQIGFRADRVHPKVPGNYQDEIATPLFREWKALDEKCAALPENFVFNVTDRGARLRNTTVVPPADFAIGEPAPEKAPRLAQLTHPAAPDSLVWQRAQNVIRDTAARAETLLKNPRAPQALAAAFRDQDIGRLFGNYSLKVLPHLLRPAETDAALWPPLLDECRALLSLAREMPSVRSRLEKVSRIT